MNREYDPCLEFYALKKLISGTDRVSHTVWLLMTLLSGWSVNFYTELMLLLFLSARELLFCICFSFAVIDLESDVGHPDTEQCKKT